MSASLAGLTDEGRHDVHRFESVRRLSFSTAIGMTAVVLPAPAVALPVAANVVFEVTGSGSVYTIDTDPAGERVYSAALPWQRTITIGPGVQLLQGHHPREPNSDQCETDTYCGVDDSYVAEYRDGECAATAG